MAYMAVSSGLGCIYRVFIGIYTVFLAVLGYNRRYMRTAQVFLTYSGRTIVVPGMRDFHYMMLESQLVCCGHICPPDMVKSRTPSTNCGSSSSLRSLRFSRTSVLSPRRSEPRDREALRYHYNAGSVPCACTISHP